MAVVVLPSIQEPVSAVRRKRSKWSHTLVADGEPKSSQLNGSAQVDSAAEPSSKRAVCLGGSVEPEASVIPSAKCLDLRDPRLNRGRRSCARRRAWFSARRADHNVCKRREGRLNGRESIMVDCACRLGRLSSGRVRLLRRKTPGSYGGAER
jgi:hypothetical protein